VLLHIECNWEQACHLVLATVLNWWFSSGSVLEPNWNRCSRFYHIKKLNCTEPVVFQPVPQFRKVRTLPPIKYLSCDLITIRYICQTCSFSSTFTSHSPIKNRIIIRWVTSKNSQFSALFHTNSTDSNWITNWQWEVKERLKLHLLHICHIVIPWIVTGSRTIRSAHTTTMTTPQKKPPKSLLLIKSSLVANITFYLNKL